MSDLLPETSSDALSTGHVDDDNELEWPGDAPATLDQWIDWQEHAGGEPTFEVAVRLYAGEVIYRSGKGEAGPFYVHQLAAAAWAFSTALKCGAGSVFECQVVPYSCARTLAPGLLSVGSSEEARFRRFFQSPLRTAGLPTNVALPGGPE